MQQMTKDASALTSALSKRKCRLETNGIDNNLLLWDLGELELVGIVSFYFYQYVMEIIHVFAMTMMVK